MSSSLETTRPEALDALREAIHEVVAYRQDPTNRRRLDVASAKIKSALKDDPGYLRAIYYDAIVDDLMGRSAEASPKYEQVLRTARADSTFLQEVQYNLGVAYYHGYSWSSLDKAIPEFTRVLAETKDPSLRILAMSGRAQAYAMHMIPPIPANVDLSLVVRYSRLCQADIRPVLSRGSRLWRALTGRSVDRSAEKAAEWAAHNASGMRRMYLTDYWEHLDTDQRLKCGENPKSTVLEIVGSALIDLAKAEAVRPRDWANWCDMASAHMRLGRSEPNVEKANVHFAEAVAQLTEVTKELRPNYGFALYELGRVYRLWGKFDEAANYLNAALKIPKHEREVGDTRVNLELDRAKAKSKEYP